MPCNVHRQVERQSRLLACNDQRLVDTLGRIVAGFVERFGIVEVKTFFDQIEDIAVALAFLLPLMQDTQRRFGKRNDVPLVGLNHNLPQLLALKIDMTPLQCHHIDNAQSAGVESKEEHFQKLLPAWFCTGFVIFQQYSHLLFCEILAAELALLVRKRHLRRNAHILNEGIDRMVNHFQFGGIGARFQNRRQCVVDGRIAVLLNLSALLGIFVD